MCLMEGALGERLKREYHLTFDEHVDMAGLVYSENINRSVSSLGVFICLLPPYP